MEIQGGKMKRILLVCIILMLVFASGCVQQKEETAKDDAQVQQAEKQGIEENLSEIIPKEEKSKLCSEPVQIIKGYWSDPEVAQFSDGSYRIYYNCGGTGSECKPETSNKILSLRSNNGIIWNEERGERESYARQAGILKMDDGELRMFYTSSTGNEIFMSSSTDGLNFKDKKFIIGRGGLGENDGDGISAPSVIKADSLYRMYYVGRSPNDIDSIFSATTKDLKTWAKEGRRIDGADLPFYGKIDGPYVIKNGSRYIMYLWNLPPSKDSAVKDAKAGIYRGYSDDGLNFKDFELVLEAQSFDKVPSDPAVMKKGDKWEVYYNIYAQGIFKMECS